MAIMKPTERMRIDTICIKKRNKGRRNQIVLESKCSFDVLWVSHWLISNAKPYTIKIDTKKSFKLKQHIFLQRFFFLLCSLTHSCLFACLLLLLLMLVQRTKCPKNVNNKLHWNCVMCVFLLVQRKTRYHSLSLSLFFSRYNAKTVPASLSRFHSFGLDT